MKYLITTMYIGNSDVIEIKKEEYEFQKEIREKLFEVLKIEENFNLIINSFLDYENELSKITNERIFSKKFDKLFFENARVQINLKIINIFTICRMYIDTTNQHLNQIYSSNNLSKQIDTLKNKMYDTKIGYRSMEVIRNHVQHRGYPIHALKINQKSISMDKNSSWEYIAMPLISYEQIKKSKSIKKLILEEFNQIKDDDGFIDIRPLMREYLEGLWEIHKKIREEIEEDLNIWISAIEEIYNRFRQKYNTPFYDNEFHLQIAIQKERHRLDDSFPLLLKTNNRIKKLQNKNVLNNNFKKCYSTNKIIF